MKVSELRIGNYVNRLGYPEQIKSISISEGNRGYVSVESSGVITHNQIEPIPLTDEWLISLGFEMSSTGFIEKGRLLYHKEYGWKILENWVKGWVGVAEILYVHQLQNIYYALTGKELTADPTRIHK